MDDNIKWVLGKIMWRLKTDVTNSGLCNWASFCVSGDEPSVYNVGNLLLCKEV
jgi:uncharacterized Fe-S cluster protein YjdI